MDVVLTASPQVVTLIVPVPVDTLVVVPPELLSSMLLIPADEEPLVFVFTQSTVDANLSGSDVQEQPLTIDLVLDRALPQLFILPGSYGSVLGPPADPAMLAPVIFGSTFSVLGGGNFFKLPVKRSNPRAPLS